MALKKKGTPRIVKAAVPKRTHKRKGNAKLKAPAPIRAVCSTFDRATGAISGGITGSAKRIGKTVKKSDRNLNRIGDVFEKLYETQSKAGF